MKSCNNDLIRCLDCKPRKIIYCRENSNQTTYIVVFHPLTISFLYAYIIFESTGPLHNLNDFFFPHYSLYCYFSFIIRVGCLMFETVSYTYWLPIRFLEVVRKSNLVIIIVILIGSCPRLYDRE